MMGVALRTIPPCEQVQSTRACGTCRVRGGAGKLLIPAFLHALDRVRKDPFLVVVPLPGKGNPVHLPHQAKPLQQPDEGAREIRLPPVQIHGPMNTRRLVGVV